MRRKTMKTIWIVLIVSTVLLFLLQNWLCTSKRKSHLEKEKLELKHSDVSSSVNYEDSNPRKSLTDRSIVVWVPPNSGVCDVSHFTRVPGWRTVVVGGSERPTGCGFSECTFLTLEMQEELGFSLTHIIPRYSESRKMIGYLYAISKGAKFILDTECNIIPSFSKLDFIFSTNSTGLLFTGSRLFNPFRHFGYPMLFPRGFPTSKWKAEDKYRIVDIPTPLIQQSQINFILHKNSSSSLSLSAVKNISFDRSAPPVFLSRDHFAPINSLSTLFLYEALWLLVLPTKCEHAQCDTVRGYWAQRLVQESGGTTGFLSSTAHSIGNFTKRKSLVLKAESVDTTTEKLVELLSNWNCSLHLSLFKCARVLYNKLAVERFINKNDVKMYDSWINDLKMLGYSEPYRKRFSPHKLRSYWNPLVIYSPPKSLASNIHLGDKESKTSALTSYIFKPMEKLCPHHRTSVSQWLSPIIKDILLLVIFNYDFLYENIPYIEFIHRPYFRHILYCGPKLASFEAILKEFKIEHIIFVEGLDVDQWFYLYTCMIHAATMNINVKGFLHIGDDILLNTWNIVDLPRDQIWMQHPFTKVGRGEEKHRFWYYWNKPQGRIAVNRALDEITQISKNNPDDKIIKKFLEVYKHNIGMEKVIHRSVDIFYLPARFGKDFVHLAKIFRKNNVLLALTVTCIHAGLDSLDHVVNLRGKSLWREARKSVWKYFDTSHHYLHPFKAGKDLQDPSGQRFFCDKYLKTSEIFQNKMHVKE